MFSVVMMFLRVNGAKIMKHWKVLVVASLLGFIWYQNTFDVRMLFGIDTVGYYKSQITELEKDLKTSQDNEKLLSTAIDDQNSEIEKWKAVSDVLDEQNQNLVNTLQHMQTQTNSDVADIINAPTPKTCEEAFEFLKGGADDLRWTE